MQKLQLALCFAFALALPGLAKAGAVFEASLGKGMQVSPSIDQKLQQTNLLLAAGYGLGEVIRLEAGFVFDLPQEREDGDREFDLRFRPMLVIDPPILPIYGRIIAGMANVFDSDSRAFEFGGALGVGASFGGVGLYAEAGVLPQSVDSKFIWLAEGRAGFYYAM